MTYDAVVLEFDFVPSADTVYFTYVFGSDEYLEWVNLFNDVFAFYVNGQNCATVPGGPVSIDTINDAVNAALFRDNSFSAPPANPINIQSDGLSVELICSAPVTPNVINHMKLALADTSDQILDSVVMIKAASLSVVPPESCNNSVDDDDDGHIDMDDTKCQTTTTPPPAGGGGIGGVGGAPAFTGIEGTPILLDPAVFGWVPQGDTVSTTWTVVGINGATDTCEISPAGYQLLDGGNIATATAICPQEGEYKATVQGWPSASGGLGDEFGYDVDFFVHNAPPSVGIAAPLATDAITTGQAVDLIADVTDPGTYDTATCSWVIGSSNAACQRHGSAATPSTVQALIDIAALVPELISSSRSAVQPPGRVTRRRR